MKLKTTCNCRALATLEQASVTLEQTLAIVEQASVTLNEVKGLSPSASGFFAPLRMTCVSVTHLSKARVQP